MLVLNDELRYKIIATQCHLYWRHVTSADSASVSQPYHRRGQSSFLFIGPWKEVRMGSEETAHLLLSQIPGAAPATT